MSLFDPPKPYLNPALWTTDEHLKPEVKPYLIKLLGKIFPFEKVYELVMIGSSVGHQYSETSDIDINVTARKGEDFETWHSIFKTFNNTPNLYPGTKHPINFFFQEYQPGSIADWSNSLGAYNIMTDQWEKRPIPFHKLGNPEEKYYREIAYGKMLIGMIDSEVLQIERAKAAGNQIDANRRLHTLAVLFKTLEENRKAAYKYGTGTPALQEHNIVYKLIDSSTHGPLMHQLIEMYDKDWKPSHV